MIVDIMENLNKAEKLRFEIKDLLLDIIEKDTKENILVHKSTKDYLYNKIDDGDLSIILDSNYIMEDEHEINIEYAISPDILGDTEHTVMLKDFNNEIVTLEEFSFTLHAEDSEMARYSLASLMDDQGICLITEENKLLYVKMEYDYTLGNYLCVTVYKNLKRIDESAKEFIIGNI